MIYNIVKICNYYVLIVKFISCMIFIIRWNSKTQFPYIMLNICLFLTIVVFKSFLFLSFSDHWGLHFYFWVHMLDHYFVLFLVLRPKLQKKKKKKNPSLPFAKRLNEELYKIMFFGAISCQYPFEFSFRLLI